MELLRSMGILCLMMTGCGVSQDRESSDTDEFKQVQSQRSPKNIRDIVGSWVAVLPATLHRKGQVVRAGFEGRPVSVLQPPLRPVERPWFEEAQDPSQPYVSWLRCVEQCRFEIGESSIWNHGYLGWDMVGSSLAKPLFRGRDVTFRLAHHETKGDRGRVHIRFNRDWSRFRVLEFHLEHASRDPHLGQKLELLFEREER